jgi:hypothetical protein
MSNGNGRTRAASDEGNDGTIGNYYALPGTKAEDIGIDPNDIVEVLIT